MRSQTFPGLHLNDRVLLTGDLAALLATVQAGVKSEEHTAFVQQLQLSERKQLKMNAKVETRYEHIVLDSDGVAKIAGTRIKVAHLAVEHVHWGWSAEEIAYQHPPLTLGQVYSALAYYWDHQGQIDAYLQKKASEAETLRQSLPEFPRMAEFRARYHTK